MTKLPNLQDSYKNKNMRAIYHPDYVRQLFQNENAFDLHQFFIALRYDRQLPASCQLLSSVLCWISATRSGVWTYYESTSPAEQQALLNTLVKHETLNFLTERYHYGMENWQNENALNELDHWLDENEKRIHQLLIYEVKKDEQAVVRLASK